MGFRPAAHRAGKKPKMTPIAAEKRKDRGALQERTFDELVRAGLDATQMPTTLARLVEAVLSEEWGMNLRNRVAHGMITQRECSTSNLARLWHLGLVVATWRGDRASRT